MRIFAVDDSPSVLSFLTQAIESIGSYEILSFLDPAAALNVMSTVPADLVLVDYTMPGMNGIELISHLRRLSSGRDVPVIMLTSETAPSIKMSAIEAGATEFLTKPIDKVELTIRLRNLLALREAQQSLAQHARSLEQDVATACARIAAQEKELIWRLCKAMACRDGETALHLERVAVVARMIAQELGLSAATCEMIALASPLHDVGKIGVSDAILLKPGPLDTRQMEEMRSHAAFGAEILSGSDSDLIKTAERIAGSHHEKWDGSGYPNGLAGTDIPIEGRIVAIADVFDALCSERPYKRAWHVDKAREEIGRGTGAHFDPHCVEAFERRWPEIRAIYSAQEKGSALSNQSAPSPMQINKTAETAA